MRRTELEGYINELLSVDQIGDYCPNGLQVEGGDSINTIVTGVTASQALIDAAVKADADALLVHHGYFWKSEPAAIVGMKKRRIQSLLQHELNLFGYHLPLDVHPELGNNAQLARLMGWDDYQPLSGITPNGVVMTATLSDEMSAESLAGQLEQVLQRALTCFVSTAQPIKRLAWCTGGGQGYIDAAAAAGCDAFITGEVSEQTVHSAREQGIAFYAAGHHATERYGIKALGEHLAKRFNLTHHFIDIDNPA
ncbi:metal-binding protein [Pseudidiomarina salinarum]|uniref:GTP cyclohydrolase 1 type 2 homolog n=1 Tax=Pseudidiomarina salinarum TaxID=435908 RepID=A0A094J1N9_9GAMM|nr:Nif3-like dinuclear metal center hexameric protein [Pseudidiomarina salinarum]KFZ31974.1 metal-binding protein [Pseudidiomarina salinarum]RUO70249.1 Nif3-like dinuclear metal center hexameric protein [Pseudidiomarina salinarum]